MATKHTTLTREDLDQLDEATLIKMVANAYDRKVNLLLRPYGLQHGQLKVLVVLFNSPHLSAKQVQLEHVLGLSNPTITGILHKLERSGYVKRVSNDDDRRSKQVVLTAKAEEQRDELLKIVGEAHELFDNALDANDTQALRKLVYQILLAQ